MVLNRSGDLLFIEQKNGALAEGKNGLTKQYQDGSRNPVEQVHRSMEKVRDKFLWQHGKKKPLHIDYLIYLPDYRVRDLNAAGLDVSRVIDVTNNDLLPTRIQEILGPSVTANDGWYEKVHEFFCQTFEVVPGIQDRRDSQERTFVCQVGPVASVLANLEMKPFRLRFNGNAGSGKSLVARTSAEGKCVLLTCFNRPLAQRFRERVPKSGYVDTFHGFCV